MRLHTLITLIIIGYSSTSIANQSNDKCYSNLDLSLSLRSSQISLYHAHLLMNDDEGIDHNISSSTFIRSNDYKCPKTTFLIAFFPGFIFHGLGHFYINENKTGAILLAAEGVSLFFLYAGAIGSITQPESDVKSINPEVLAITGLGLFFGSWIYDWGAATRKAQKKKRAQAFMIFPSIDEKQININFAINW